MLIINTIIMLFIQVSSCCLGICNVLSLVMWMWLVYDRPDEHPRITWKERALINYKRRDSTLEKVNTLSKIHQIWFNIHIYNNIAFLRNSESYFIFSDAFTSLDEDFKFWAVLGTLVCPNVPQVFIHYHRDFPSSLYGWRVEVWHCDCKAHFHSFSIH